MSTNPTNNLITSVTNSTPDRRKFLTTIALGAAAAVPAAALLSGEAEALPSRIRDRLRKRRIMRSKILNFAETNMGRSIGRGECTDLVSAAFAAAGAKPGSNYVWGTAIDMQYAIPGCVVQFFKTKFTSPDGRSWWGTSTQHTAIIASVSGARVTLYEQNVNGKRSVVKNSYDLSWPHTGTVVIYSPVAA